MTLDTDKEVQILKDTIKAEGSKNSEGQHVITYGVLFDKTQNTLEALNGTLKKARRSKIVAFDGELLMMPMHKDVIVTLLDE